MAEAKPINTTPWRRSGNTILSANDRHVLYAAAFGKCGHADPFYACNQATAELVLHLSDEDFARIITAVNAFEPMREALLLLQGQDFRLQDDANGREIRRRVLAALALSAPPEPKP